MKKKIVSLCAAFAITVMSVMPAHAVDNYAALRDVITGYAASVGAFQDGLNVDLDVLTNMERARTGGTYTDETGAVVAYVPTSSPTAKFDYKTTMKMDRVRGAMTTYWLGALLAIDDHEERVPGSRASLLDTLNNVPVTGGFTVDVIYPDSVTLPVSVLTGSNMQGFTQLVPDGRGYREQPISGIFKEISREELANTPAAGQKTFRIKIEVKDVAGTGVLRGEELNANLNTYLGDIVLTCKELAVRGIGTHNIKGTVNGYTNIGGTYEDYSYSDFEINSVTDQIALVEYEAVQGENSYDAAGQAIEEEVILATPTPIPTTPPGGGGGGGGAGGGGGPSGYLPGAGGGPVNVPTPSPVPGGELIPADPETDVVLNKDDHYAYIIGYPEGDVRPSGNITRAEVATIFFRIMGDESRDKYATSKNNYPDVNREDWYNNAISTVTAAGIVNGYLEDGTFRPQDAISRAEFATMAARFISAKYRGEDLFSDISGHWASKYINRACKYGWINGYGDGTFAPDKKITRAEAMTLVNTVLGRKTHPDKMHRDMVAWVDNVYGMWYYAAVQEATNPHTYVRDEIGDEVWTGVMPNRDWEALEDIPFEN